MDNKEYYEFYDWSKIDEEKLKPLIHRIEKIIPEDVKSILDIGCGNGVITTRLSRKYHIVGVDRSEQALSHLETGKILASCDNVPVEDRSYDLVLSTEMLEHLDDEVFHKTIGEFRRISRRYILITVPNSENIKKLLIKCPKCAYVYNRSYHLRSFTKKELSESFPGYRMIDHAVLGPKVRDYNNALSWIKRKLTPSHAWIPLFWTPADQRKSLCPNCEHTFEYSYKFHLLAYLTDLGNVVISSKKPYWQMALFERAGEE